PRRDPAATAGDDRRRTPNLFERMTGSRPRQDRPVEEPAAPARAPATTEAPLRPQHGDRLTVESFEDVLDIPAFLRRQAN
ncbi:MAG: cell division protein FtsZ, partial [Alphaproteobacteria bacterium]